MSIKGKVLSISLILLVAFGARGQLLYDGVILDHENRWDGYPVHLLVDGVHHIWFCAQSPETNGDSIYHSQNSQGLADTTAWSTPTELFDVRDVPWANSGGGSHACDPTIIRGEFEYQSTDYSYALYFTSDTTTANTGDNAVGVAFSNDGTSWVVHDQPVILPDGGFDGTYGAGASGVAWGPGSKKLIQLYRDSTTELDVDFRIRFKESEDGLTFAPTPSLDTLISEASTSNLGTAPELAFYPTRNQWFGSIQEVAGGDEFTGRFVKSDAPDSSDIFSSWTTEFGMNGSLSNEGVLLLPSMARTENGTLYVDQKGWTYHFFATGNHPEDGDGVFTWKVGQARYRLFSSEAFVLEDTFTNSGPTRAIGSPLAGLQLETGAPHEWIASDNLVLDDGGVTPSVDAEGFIATAPYDLSTQNSPRAHVKIEFDPAGGEWVAVGFSNTHSGLFGGELWALYNPNIQRVTAFADGTSTQLLDESVTSGRAGLNELEITYHRDTNTMSVYLNADRVGLKIELDSFGVTPSIQRAGFHFHFPTATKTRVERFQLNAIEVFCDGFETGDLSRWSGTN